MDTNRSRGIIRESAQKVLKDHEAVKLKLARIEELLDFIESKQTEHKTRKVGD